MLRKLFLCLLTALFFTGCASIPVPPGIDSNIFKNTKKKTVTAAIGRGKTKRISFVKGPDQKIDDEPGEWSLIKFKDGEGNIRYRMLYRCYEISVGRVTELYTDTPLITDLLMQTDAGGVLVETGAVDIDRELLDKSLTTGRLAITLTSKGSGTVFTPTIEMLKAEARDDWKSIGKMIEKGEGYKSRYVYKNILIKVPAVYLAAFLKKADLIDIKLRYPSRQ